MIIAERKPLDEIKSMVEGFDKVLVIGCGTCVSVCLVGGSKEVATLNAELRLAFGKPTPELGAETLKRQCDMEFLSELDTVADEYDAFLSMACGAGIQFLAERFPEKPVFPAVNTVSISVNKDVGVYEEKCRACGTCVLGMTGGICPVTTPTLKSPLIKNIRTSSASNRSFKNSVCPGKENLSDCILSLLIGPVTRTSILETPVLSAMMVTKSAFLILKGWFLISYEIKAQIMLRRRKFRIFFIN